MHSVYLALHYKIYAKTDNWNVKIAKQHLRLRIN